MSSDSEWNSFTNLSRSSDEDFIEEDEEDIGGYRTHNVDVTRRFGRVIQMPFLKVK